MLRPVSDSLYNHLLTNFPPGIAYPRVVFEGEPMPQPLAHFLSRTLQYRLDIALDQLRKARSDWFDYNHPNVQKAYTTFISAINKHGHIPAEAWEKTLNQAVRYVTAYLVRPVSTLVDFVYHDSTEPLAPPIIQRRMSYFGPYSYFREATEAYFERKQLTALERERFVSLLTRVDQHLTQKYRAEQWIRLLQPLFALTTAIYPAGLPIPLLRMFFLEKGATAVERALGEEQAKWGVDFLDATGLRKVLDAVASPKARPQTPATPPLPATTPTASAQAQAPNPSLPQSPQSRPMPASTTMQPPQQRTPQHSAPAPTDQSVDQAPGGVPLWQRFQKRDTPGKPQSILQRPTTSQASAPQTVQSNAEQAVPLWKRFQKATPGETQPSHPATPNTSKLLHLEQTVLGPHGPQMRERFVQSLFGGSVQAYVDALEQLSSASDWAQASQIIARDVFQQYKVNIYDDHAVAFTNTVEARYQRHDSTT